jgi:hypothetical protein
VVVLRDAMLHREDANKHAQLLVEQERTRRRIRARTAARRDGGVRCLKPLPFEEDPDWDPNEPTSTEVDYANWAASVSTSSGGGFATESDALEAIERIRVRELVSLALDQLADDRADKGLLPA